MTDNIADRDGYRFHDVFHFAYAAILHWSPVVRALIKHKRKSSAECDENQDGGRAIVVEEGLTAWIFAKAKELKFFEGQERVSLGVLKTIGEFVTGYEVSQCPLKLWERAILDGYDVFRQLRAAAGDSGRRDPGVQAFAEKRMAGHLMTLATLLVKPEPPALAMLKVIPNLHHYRRADPREAVDHRPD